MANEELNKRVYVREVKEAFGLEQLAGSDDSLNRWIIAPDINRPGLELSGYLESNDLKRVVIMGDSAGGGFSLLLAHRPEFFLAYQRDFPVFRYDGKTYQLITDLVSFLSEKLAPTDSLYGVMMNIYGRGIMITGKSGIGKSELALDLINRGHMLVADDRIDVTRVHTSIMCTAPKLLKRMLEIRGLGIVDVTRMFGANAYLNKCQLDFVIKLVKYNEDMDQDRLNPINETRNILGLDVPMLTIPITEGKSLSVIIEAAVANYLLDKLGFNSNEDFKRRYHEELQNNKGGQ